MVPGRRGRHLHLLVVAATSSLLVLLLQQHSSCFTSCAAAFHPILVVPSSPSRPSRHSSTRRTRLYITINDPLGDPLGGPTNNNKNMLKFKGHVTAGAGAAGAAKQELRKKANLKPFERYLEVECWKKSELRGLEPVMQAVAAACKQINRIVQRAQTDDIYGAAVILDDQGNAVDGSTNIQGEVQQKLDVLCNTIMMRAFCASSRNIRAVASEEEDQPRCCSDVMNDSAFAIGEFVAVFDPLDGSKNIDASLPVGSIFGIYRPNPGTTAEGKTIDKDTFLVDGNSLVAAGYCLFSATTVLVLTLGSGVDGFTLDPDNGRFLHTHRDIRIPKAGPIYSFNEANYRYFEEPIKRYLNALKEGSSSVGVRSNARYMGALVADVHNILINGGIYGYPPTLGNPNGKLRLMYESNPMAFIIEQAGGAGSTGFGRIMDIKPKSIHQRVPTYLGSVENVFELDQFVKYYSDVDEMQQQYES